MIFPAFSCNCFVNLSAIEQIVHFSGMPTAFVSDTITGEMWIDFCYKGWKFSIHNPYGKYWFLLKTANAQKPYCNKYMIQAV